MKFPSLRPRRKAALKRGAPESAPALPGFTPMVTTSVTVHPEVKSAEPRQAVEDRADARWEPAHFTNYRTAHRPHDFPIDRIVIHVAGRPFSEIIDQSKLAATGVAFHYLVGQDGTITQMIREEDYALHAGDVVVNQRSIAVQHEGECDGSQPFSEAMYRASAALVRQICLRHGIPMDRDHIIGHNEVPGTEDPDPGIYWDWTRYMALVCMEDTIVVDTASPGRFWCSAGWKPNSWYPQRPGHVYQMALSHTRTDAAWFKLPFPRTGYYSIDIRYPSSPSFCDATPVIILTADGPHVVRVNQRIGGGRWMPLGTFFFLGGDHWAVGVDRATKGEGHVVADAIRLVPVRIGEHL